MVKKRWKVVNRMNKQLTKEECIEAFKRLNGMILTSPFYQDEIDLNDLKVCGTQLQDDFMDNVQVFAQLIDEHFGNPPLKFEELHEDMWVWDNLVKGYMRIYGKEIKYNEELVEYCCGFIDFEENRFYRYEVKENENGV